MAGLFARLLKRTLRLALEGVAALLALGFMLSLLLVWRANQGPIVIDSIAPQLGQLLSNERAGIRMEIGHAQFMWFKDDQALRLVASTVQVFDRQNHLLAELPQLSLGLNFLAPLRGQLAPLEIFSHDFTLKLARGEDGALQFGDVGLEETSGDAGLALAGAVRQFLQLEDAEWLGLNRIGAVKLARFNVRIVDRKNRSDWGLLAFPRFALIRQLDTASLEAEAFITLGAARPSHVRFDAAYHHDAKQMTLKARAQDFNAAHWARMLGLPAAFRAADTQLDGTLSALFDDEVRLQHIAADLRGGAGHITMPDLWPQPLSMDALELQIGYAPQPRHLLLHRAALNVGGVKLTLQGEARPEGRAQPDVLRVTAGATITDWPLDRLAEIWPPALAPAPRAWMAEHMRDGTFTNAEAAMDFKTSGFDFAAAHDFKLKGKIALQNATVHYLPGMPPVTGVHGEAEATEAMLTINVAGGKADRVALGPSPIVISGLNDHHQAIAITLTGKNSIGDIMRLIDHPPLHYAAKLGLKPEDMSGQADLDVRIGFPLVKDLKLDSLLIDARAPVKDFASDKLVKGIAISRGALNLAVDSSKLTAEGRAAFNGVMLETSYRQHFYPDDKAPEIAANLQGLLQPDDLNALGVPGSSFVIGDIPAKLVYDKPFAAPGLLQFNADLTAAALALPMLNWTKPPQQAAQAQAKLLFDKTVQMTEVKLSGPALAANLSGVLDASLQPESLICQPCRIGRTDVKAKAAFTDGRLTVLDLSGAVLDYRNPTPPGQPQPAPQPLQLNLDLGRYYQSDTGFFANLRGNLRRDTIGWAAVDLRAVAQGRVPLSVMLAPQPNGARRLTIVTDDLGDVLRATAITDQLHEGHLLVSGVSTAQNPARIAGTIKLRDYRVRQLPVLAVLLNAASIAGLADMMAGDGLTFDRLEGGFIWEGQRYQLIDIRTAGGALGLNVEGMLDFAAGRADLQGTIVPFSFFNSIIGAVPLVGDLLTGGKGGGVFAATYQARGPIGNMNVTVNPVSFLAPGIVRRIFFQN